MKHHETNGNSMQAQEDSLIPSLMLAFKRLQGFGSSFAIFHLFESGIYDELVKGPITVDLLASSLKLQGNFVRSILEYCILDGLVVRDGIKYILSSEGESIYPTRGWFQLFVGGYADTLKGLGGTLRNGKYPERDGRYVGVGSCQISKFGAFPLLRKFINSVGVEKGLVVDIGCGDCLNLTTLCQMCPEIRAIGVEPKAEIVQAAREMVEAHHMSDRITIVQSDFLTFTQNYRGEEPDFIVTSFLLQEVLAQAGEKAMIRALTDIGRRFRAYLGVIEVDLRPIDDPVLQTPMGKGYYHLYYLLHRFTNQQLQPKEYWRETFAQCGFTIINESPIDENADTTKLELGFLLQPNSRRQARY
jgi:2-ketoarginine methyltransferase